MGVATTVDADDDGHRVAVSAWYERVASARTSASIVTAFSEAFAVLWQRTHQTLGDVTLIAIVDRVLLTAAEQFPLLTSLAVVESKLDCRDLVQATKHLDEISAGVQFVLLEFLTVLGKLTAQILTPALHLELSLQPSGSHDPQHRARVTSEDEAR